MPGARIEGRVEMHPRRFVFVPESSRHAAAPLSIDYESIRHLEFGQRTSRRVPLVVAAAAVLGPVGLVSLSAKSRAHDLTVTYAGEHGRTEVIVIELGKHVVAHLAAVEARSGSRSVGDEEARKWRRGAAAARARFCCPAPPCGGTAYARIPIRGSAARFPFPLSCSPARRDSAADYYGSPSVKRRSDIPGSDASGAMRHLSRPGNRSSSRKGCRGDPTRTVWASDGRAPARRSDAPRVRWLPD